MTTVRLESPAPEQRVAMPWLERLTQFQTVESLRDDIAGYYPELQPGRFGELIILGAAEEGRRLLQLCNDASIQVVAICDDNPAYEGEVFGGCSVQSVSALEGMDLSIPVVIASHRLLGVYRRLQTMGRRHVIPFALLQVLMPKCFPAHMFYEGLIEDLLSHHERYVELAALLDDDYSRRVLDTVIGFRQTLNPELLGDIVDDDLYYPAGLVNLGQKEVYLDGGAFDGDSVRMFQAQCHGEYERIVAFEPDPVTYERLVAAFRDDDRVEAVNRGLYDSVKILRFNDSGSRTAIFDVQGSLSIPVTSIDEFLAGDRVSYIKMNIEGAELQALRGAQKTIRSYAPKLAISAYHRPSDLWRVPFLIKELAPDYRLHLRQHDGGIIETVNYAIPQAKK